MQNYVGPSVKSCTTNNLPQISRVMKLYLRQWSHVLPLQGEIESDQHFQMWTPICSLKFMDPEYPYLIGNVRHSNLKKNQSMFVNSVNKTN